MTYGYVCRDEDGEVNLYILKEDGCIQESNFISDHGKIYEQYLIRPGHIGLVTVELNENGHVVLMDIGRFEMTIPAMNALTSANEEQQKELFKFVRTSLN